LWVRFYNLAAVRLLRRKEIEEDRDEQFMGDLDELLAEIERVGALAAAGPDRDSERRLLRLRHIAGTCLIDRALEGAEFVAPDALGVSGPSGGGLPVIERGALTAAAVRAGILAGGCVRVPSLIPRQDALELAAAIERAFTERERQDVGEPAGPPVRATTASSVHARGAARCSGATGSGRAAECSPPTRRRLRSS
jgi:hypothetical protein